MDPGSGMGGFSMTLFSRILYTAIAFTLLAAAILLIGVAVWRTATGYWTGDNALETMLDGIGLIIIAVAVADVGKFLYEEEVVSDRELRRPAEARGSLTKFMTIMIVALSLESLVLIAKTTRETMGNIIYPSLLVFLAVTAMVGLGLFQKLSQNATAAVPPDRVDDEEEDEEAPAQVRAPARRASPRPVIST
jgi:cytochrome c-type biogenesis protein CcmH/NrfG